jgi:hypothetical protein
MVELIQRRISDRSRSLAAGLTVFLLTLVFSMMAPINRAEAACGVPNQISNGQVADATAVMGNFNALTNCANSAVSPSGSPAAGNVAVFSGPNTITSGNLAGDCVTAGTLAVVCTKSNGEPFSYFATGTDGSQLTGTVSVNRFDGGNNADSTHFLRGDGVWATPSGGGGGGNWWAGHAPQATDFTPWHGATTGNVDLTLTYDANVGLILDSGGLAGGENVRFAEKAAPSHSADFTITTRITPDLYPVNYNIVGQTLREPSANISVIFGFMYGGGPFIDIRTQTGTSYIATWGTEQRIASNVPYWSRIRYVHSSDTYYFDFSLDGGAWVTISSATRTSLFGAANTPTMQGLGFYVNNGSTTKHDVASCDYYVVQ